MMTAARVITVERDVRAETRPAVDAWRHARSEAGTLVVNLISSPGAGKTTLLAALARHWTGWRRMGVLVGDIAWAENKAFVGQQVEVLFAAGEGRKDAATARMSGRARDNRLVHVAVPDDEAARPRPGDVGVVEVTYAAPHHLNADAGPISLERTRGGDAWAARHAERAAVVGLGLPVRRPS